MKQTGWQALKFGLVGLANTAVGLAVILGAMQVFGAPPVVANAVGYIAGLGMSFYGNSRWTFKHRVSWASAMRFVAAFGVSYLVNIAVLLGMINVLDVTPVLAQIFAVLSYTVVFFALSKVFVYSGPASGRTAKAAAEK